MNNGLEAENGTEDVKIQPKDDHLVKTEQEDKASAITATPAPGASKSAVLPRRRLRDLPVAASTDTGLLQLSKLEARSQFHDRKRDGLIDEEDEQE